MGLPSLQMMDLLKVKSHLQRQISQVLKEMKKMKRISKRVKGLGKYPKRIFQLEEFGAHP